MKCCTYEADHACGRLGHRREGLVRGSPFANFKILNLTDAWESRFKENVPNKSMLGELMGNANARYLKDPPKTSTGGRRTGAKGTTLLFMVSAFVVVGLLSAACNELEGSGNVITKEEDFKGVTSVVVENSFEVQIVKSDSFSTVITADDNVMDHVQVSKSGETLRIRLDRGGISNATLEANVTLPNLRKLRLTGATKGTVSGFKSSDDLDIDVARASSLTGDIKAGDIDVNVAGASKVTLKGSGKELIVRGSGAIEIDLKEFVVNDAEVKLSGASTASLNAEGLISPVNLSGASNVTYTGSATLDNINTSGASKIRRK